MNEYHSFPVSRNPKSPERFTKPAAAALTELKYRSRLAMRFIPHIPKRNPAPDVLRVCMHGWRYSSQYVGVGSNTTQLPAAGDAKKPRAEIRRTTDGRS